MSDIGVLLLYLLLLSTIMYFAKEIYLYLTQKSLKGEIAFITGGGQGLGKIIGMKLAREGCHIAIVDINKPNIDDTVKEIQSLGVRCCGYQYCFSFLSFFSCGVTSLFLIIYDIF